MPKCPNSNTLHIARLERWINQPVNANDSVNVTYDTFTDGKCQNYHLCKTFGNDI